MFKLRGARQFLIIIGKGEDNDEKIQNYRRTLKDKILALSLDKPVDEEGTPLITLIEDDSSFFQT
ncbi:unnamed protein product, partial [marine sediment metagenome]